MACQLPTHTHILTRSKRESVIEGEEREVRRLFVASLLTGCWFGREPPKVVEKKACVRMHAYVCEWVSLCVCMCVFCTCCLAAFFCQEVSNSSCVNSGLAPSITRNTSCLNKSQGFIKIAWLHSIEYCVLHVKILNYNWIMLFSILKHFFPTKEKILQRWFRILTAIPSHYVSPQTWVA